MKYKAAFILLVIRCVSFAQIPSGYYNTASGLNGSALQQALHTIIKNHMVVPYGNLYQAFAGTDLRSDSSIWDIYSDNPTGPEPYTYYDNATWQCGNYNSEGDCFNREHSWPQSWFNGQTPTYSDLFHIYPTDGWVNGKRANYPYGEVANPTYTSSNGGKLGPNTTVGYTLTVFEPIDEYKGDLARGYFYLATRYLGEDSAWGSSDATNKAVILPWQLCLLLSWHHQDPVSAKELARNEAIYQLQGNRNPYIDRPGFADSVFACSLVSVNETKKEEVNVLVFPNPANDKLTLQLPASCLDAHYSLLNIAGEEILSGKAEGSIVHIRTQELARGLYFLVIQSNNFTETRKIILK